MSLAVRTLVPLLLILGLIVTLAAEESGIDNLRRAAEQGDAEAQFKIGVALTTGNGVVRDDSEAVKTYRNGTGIPRSLVVAHAFFSLADANGLAIGGESRDELTAKMTAEQIAEAHHLLGMIHYAGTGTPRDEAKAIEWFHRAAVQALAQAQYNLAVSYRDANDVPRDNVKAAE